MKGLNTMKTLLAQRWVRVSLFATFGALVGLGSVGAYKLTHASDDCCGMNAPCCYPGSPCCAGHNRVAQR